mgnify:CR=1 FL=1
MDFGFTRGVGGFAYRGDGLLYGALPAVNPAGTKWLAGDDALLACCFCTALYHNCEECLPQATLSPGPTE